LADWSLLTNHGRLLLAIENEPGLRVREMADRLHLSERGIALILRDLREAGYVTSRREGRRVFYSVVPTKPLRSDLLRHQTVGQLLQLLAEAETSYHGVGAAAPEPLRAPDRGSPSGGIVPRAQ
jgi:DNA-binding transcriptional ArsR family regulator